MNSYFKYTTLNRSALNKSTECACIYCLKKFNPAEIEEWCWDYDTIGISQQDTAICPHCNVDTIVPNILISYTDDNLILWRMYAGF